MSLNLNDLRNACFAAAKTRTELSGYDLTSPQKATALAELFYEVASDRSMEFFDIGREPKLVNKAVWFLSNMTISAPHGNETVWFQSCLDLLLEMAFPQKEVLESSRGDFLGHLYSRFNDAREEDEVWG